MTGTHLLQFRKHSKRTQVEAARELGVSQTYLSLLEKGKRPLTDELRSKAVHAFQLPPTHMPVSEDLSDVAAVSDDELATDLATLGYPGFAHLKKSTQKNPAVVLLSALKADNREARDVEALPWVVLTFPDMNWASVVKAAKVNDLQNRLGLVTTVARQIAETTGHLKTAAKLKTHEAELERSMLVREGTLCNDRMTSAERKWLATNRPEEAKHWRLLTDLSPRYLDHYDIMPERASMPMKLEPFKEQIQSLCVETNIAMLGVFGSVARGEDNATSDIDLLVRFKKPVGLIEMIGIEERLEKILGRPVDLGTEAGLHPLIEANVQKDLRIIYQA